MVYPLVYQINTRCWLRELSDRLGIRPSLAQVPDAELFRWAQQGFTHIWLMGVWPTGPRSRTCNLESATLKADLRRLLPDLCDDDLAGSPYAIANYEVAESLGGEKGLARFRHQLARHGLKLILDFVPNHTGLDHPWLEQHPEFYVQRPVRSPGAFAQPTGQGTIWIAHGKDPYFPPWCDTAQLDYRQQATRRAMIRELKSIAQKCDGVRCDMAMLVLNEVFTKNWAAFPGPHATPTVEFWTEAIAAAKDTVPDFLFLAEVYWGLEARLQSLGFDYTYDKLLYDSVVQHSPEQVYRHLHTVSPRFIEGSAHFLENHDEIRAAAALSFEEHRAAALLILGLPGMRLIHEGQLAGAMHKIPVQLGRRPVEAVNPAIARWYEQLLIALQSTAVGRGHAQLLAPTLDSAPLTGAASMIVVQWQQQPEAFDLVVVNLASGAGRCRVRPQIEAPADHDWHCTDLLSTARLLYRGQDWVEQGLCFELPAFGVHLWHCHRLPSAC